ncbi:small-conductance mechanosensitive ion channel [uncultured Massilia sp.]|uniref:mechanosensitive ion channel family protein n=1 Tax=uncultured Massilia sp. TaxID=169973 RepID=UPI0025D82C49|nr:small-conductance mechanosensitive ion channel [uncultured Massilia sp.]
MDPQLTDWGHSLMASLSAAMSLLFAAVPRILGFLVIVGIGWLVATLLERLLVAVLRAVHFDGFAERAGMAGPGGLLRALRREPSALLGLIAKWFVRLIVLVAAFDALGVPAVSQVLQQLLLWLPNLAVALVVLVLGGIAANALGDLVRRAAARSRMGAIDGLGTAARWVVWAFAILVAINQVGIASSLVTILFMAIVGAVALALGLSFGLGGRDTAGMIVRHFYERQRGASPPAYGASLGTQERTGRVGYTGVEQRHAPGDRRSNPNGRRAAT